MIGLYSNIVYLLSYKLKFTEVGARRWGVLEKELPFFLIIISSLLHERVYHD